ESAEDIRARFEAEADARSRARAALPSAAGEDEPEEERTRVYSRGRSVRRPTLLGGLAGAPPSDLKRRPEDTLVSAGIELPDEASDDGSVFMVVQREDGTPLSDRPGPARD